MTPHFDTIKICKLEFDTSNPRLPTFVQHSTEQDIIQYLAANTGIENLMTSIGENGFFPGEAIVVTSSKKEGFFTVLEGNRRLAALRLLQDPELMPRSRRIARAAELAIHKPVEVPAYIVRDRIDAMQYLGFRHITGVQRWDPLAKARYLKQLFDLQTGDPASCYRAVAREIGSHTPTVRDNLDALSAYNIIEKEGFYDINGLDESTFQFGVFYTAVRNADIARFIGVRQDDAEVHPTMEPDKLNKDNLKELAEWMFKEESRGGTRRRTTRLGDSRNIADLGAAIAHPDGLRQLRLGGSIESALQATVDTRDEFIRHMTAAVDSLKEANSNLHAVTNPDSAALSITEEAYSAVNVALQHLRRT